MQEPSTCRILEWDSEFFGLTVATLGEAKLTGSELDRALEWCRAQSVDCVYWLTGGGDFALHRAAHARGFQTVDVRITLEKKRASERADRAAHGAGSIRESRESDIADLRTIAAANHVDSRFYADGRFDRAKCDELYATWIEKSCRGWADVVFVAELDGAPVGYLSCHVKPDKSGSIGLVGLAAHAQGRGLGRRLVDTGVEWIHGRGGERATVVTQGCNVAAQHLYQSCGFRTASVQLWHHLWFNSASTTRS